MTVVKIEVDQHLCLPILHVGGRIHEGNFAQLDSTLARVSAEGHQLIALDLSDVRQMGESEAAKLLRVRQRLTGRCQKLALVGLSPSAIEALGRAAQGEN